MYIKPYNFQSITLMGPSDNGNKRFYFELGKSGSNAAESHRTELFKSKLREKNDSRKLIIYDENNIDKWLMYMMKGNKGLWYLWKIKCLCDATMKAK